VNSLYFRLSLGAAVTHFDDVWKTRVPPKKKIFLWKLLRGRLPMGDRLVKRQGPTVGSCALCGEGEDCKNIFFGYHLAKFM
jgi:hypothetical protein